MRVLHNAIKVVTRHLHVCQLRGIVVRTKKLVECKGIPLLVLYCCVIFEAKDLSSDRRDVTVRRPLVRFMVTGKGTLCSKMDGEKSVKAIKMT